MDEIPQIRLVTAQGKTQKYLQLKHPPYNTPNKEPKLTEPQLQSLKSTNHRLKLKDYLRLTTISKRSNSNSVKKDKSSSNINTLQTPSKCETLLDTQKSLTILKEQLKSDINNCVVKMNQVFGKVEKGGNRLESTEEEYDELVFMCQLHRIIKEGVMGSLDKANILINQHKQKQFMKFSSKAKDLISEDIKKTTTPKKRNSLHASSMRMQLKNTHY